MSTLTGLALVRADNTSLDLPLESETVLEPGTTADPPEWDQVKVGLAAPEYVPGRFCVFIEQDPDVADWAAYWLRVLRTPKYVDQGFKIVRVSFTWPDDAVVNQDLPPNPEHLGYVYLRTATVVEDLSLDDLAALAAS